MEQYYLQIDQQYHRHTSTSTISDEVYIQYIEHKKLYTALTKHQVILKFRYVNGMIYNQSIIKYR
jgi:hypothetical protein